MMIVKEWTIDETGRAKAAWVTRERPSSLEYLMKRGIIASDCDAIIPLASPVEHEIRVYMSIEKPPEQSPAEGATTDNGCSGRKWTWIYSVLKGIRS